MTFGLETSSLEEVNDHSQIWVADNGHEFWPDLTHGNGLWAGSDPHSYRDTYRNGDTTNSHDN